MDQKLLGILNGNTEKYPHNLENKFPRVFGKILSLWGSPELDGYFSELLVSNRTDRVGFPDDVVSEIMYLSFVHASLHAKKAKKKDAWDVSVDAFACLTPPSAQTPAPSAEPPDAIKLALQSYGIACSHDGFLEAAKAGNSSAVALFLEGRYNTETRDKDGWTPLIHASFNGRDAVSYMLLKHGASVNAVDFCGNSALHWAAFAGHAATAKLLIDNHADINLRSCSGWTPLLQAAARRNQEVVQLLLEHGANYNVAEQAGWTALHKAAAKGYPEIVELLLRKGANSNLTNNDGDTPFSLATKNRQNAVIQLLASAYSAAGSATRQL